MSDAGDGSRTDRASLEIAASPDAVYAAFVDPDVLVEWLPPRGMTGRVLEYDFRPDGRYRIALTHAGDAPEDAGSDHDAGLRSSLANLADHLVG